MDQAFKYGEANYLIEEKSYPYEARDDTCKYKTTPHTKEEVKRYSDVTIDSTAQLKAAVTKQPVSVAVEADQMVFQFYQSGILSSTSCGTNTDHGVLVVGYGADTTGKKYWIVKNSWGASWGDHGYLKIARDVGQPKGICGILTAPSYPTMI